MINSIASQLSNRFSHKKANIYFNKFSNEPQKLNTSVGSFRETAILTTYTKT